MPLFSVIVPTYHRNDLLALCLESLSFTSQTINSSQYEVIVSDDGKEHGAKEMLRDRFPWARWVEGPHKGPASNRNNGASHAAGDWLVFTDDDCIPHHDLLEQYAIAITQHKGASAFEGAIEYVGNSIFLQNEDFECPVNTTGGNFWSANICIQHKLFNEIEGFDKNYPHAALEDQDLYYRLQKKTGIPFVRDAIVKHPFKSISYAKKIFRLKSSTKDWSYHAQKHLAHLGYQGKADILWDSVAFYSKDIIRQVIKGRGKKAAYDLAYLIVGHLYLTYHLYSKK